MLHRNLVPALALLATSFNLTAVAWGMGAAHNTWTCRASAGEVTPYDPGSPSNIPCDVVGGDLPSDCGGTPSSGGYPISYDSDDFPKKGDAQAAALRDCRQHASHPGRCSVSCRYNQ